MPVVSRKMGALRVLVAVLLVLGLMAGFAPAANAGIVPGVLCNALAALTIGGGPGAWTWDITAGSGNCVGDGDGPYILTGSGSGTSTSLGFCDGLLVTDLAINMTWNLFSLKTLSGFSRNEFWTAPVSTFPIVTPFLVFDTDAGGTFVGAGAILNRFGGACPPGGKPQSVIIEVRLT